MTITNQDLIDAAKAIGVLVDNISFYESNPCFVFYCKSNGEIKEKIWDPQHYKSQLMDLQFKLKLSPRFIDDQYGALVFDNGQAKTFYNTFQSFAEAIILAAAEHYRAGVKKDA